MLYTKLSCDGILNLLHSNTVLLFFSESQEIIFESNNHFIVKTKFPLKAC